MKKKWMIAMLGTLAGIGAAQAEDMEQKFREMVDRSFQSRGIAGKERMLQLDFQRVCSRLDAGDKVDFATLEALRKIQQDTIRWPADGNFFGDWKRGEAIAQSGRGLTWSDKPGTVNGGGCYNCHQLDPKELSFGTIGPSLTGYRKMKGVSEESVRYTWSRLWNAKALNLCTTMYRLGDAGILTEAQLKDVMAYLFDPESPVNKDAK
ncbi:MAG: sulfur oxidation c-type cytochrome SoxX [Rhodocyclales bacterium]|nr:sulfur oxidation c-type cytochrome SoxX [Rhodocyclales bacterium]